MSNKYHLPLIIAILISTVVAVSVNQYFKPNNAKVAIVSSSSVITGVSSVIQSSVSISSITKPSSQSVESSIPKAIVEPEKVKAVESKVAEVKTVSSLKVANKSCNIPDEMVKYKSENGCYTFGINIPYDADETHPLRSKELADYTRIKLAKDFYDRVKNLTNTSFVEIRSGSAYRVSENVFYVRLSFFDIEYLKSVNISGTDADTFEAEYTVNLNDQKSFKLDKFSNHTIQ